MFAARTVAQGSNGLSGILLSAHGWFVAEATHLAIRAARAWSLSGAAQQSAVVSRLAGSNEINPQLKTTMPPAQFVSQQGLTTSSCSQSDQAGTKLTTLFAASQVNSQVNSEEFTIRQQLMDLGLPQSIAEQAIQRATEAQQPYQQLPAHLETLLKIAGPSTTSQRKSFLRSVPTLLRSTPEALTDAAVKLTELFGQLGVPGAAVQQFARQQPLVLQASPQFVAARLADWAEILGTEAADVLSRIWCADSETPLYQQPIRRVQLRVNAIKNSFQRHNKDMVQMVESWPDMLLLGPGELRDRLTAVWDCLKPHGWTREQLTPALPANPRMLARDVKQTQGVWDTVQAYAAVHPPSQQELQKIAATPEILAVFRSSERNMLLIQYVTNGIQRKMQPQADVGQGSAVNTSDGDTTNAASDLLKGTSNRGSDKGVNTEVTRPPGGIKRTKHTSPTVWQLITMTPQKLAFLVDRRYPGFWRWEKQQQQVRQRAEQLQQLEDQRNERAIKRRLRNAEEWSRRGIWRKTSGR